MDRQGRDAPAGPSAPLRGGRTETLAATGADGFAQLADVRHRLRHSLEDAGAAPLAFDTTALGPAQWAWDPASDVLDIGGDIARLFGWDGARLSGGDWIERIHPDDRSRHRELMVAHLDGLTARFDCASRMLAEGSAGYVWIFASGVALRNTVGRAQKLIGTARPLDGEGAAKPEGTPGLDGILRDVWLSGLAALEERERERAIRLAAEENTQSQREFLATVSHEIRNPLSVIFAYSDLLQESASEQGDAHVRQRLARIDNAGKHLLELVNKVLDLSRIEAGKAEIEPAEFALADLLREVEDIGAALAQKTGSAFLLEAPGDLGAMLTDRLKLRQILINLVGNAAKFTDQGTITLRVRSDEILDRIVFSVSDTGVGIPEDKLERLFKAFSQVDATAARQRGGTGLGLFISERYARLLGGAMAVDSVVGQGSTFSVSLPRRLEDVPKKPAAADHRAGRRLVIGHTEEVTSLDPHLMLRNTNMMLAQHVFEALVTRDPEGGLAPGLAERWEPLDARTWRFHLRRGARFHDGSAFDAEDVLATFRRLPAIEGGNVPFAAFIRPIERAVARDPHTLDLATRAPHPLLPNDLSNVAIIHRRFERAPTSAFDRLEATVGTGPFRAEHWAKEREIRLSAFREHWGGAPHWDGVVFRLIDDEVGSVTALVNGDVQLIDNVAPSQIPELERNPDVTVERRIVNRLWYLHLDQWRDRSPFVSDRNGRPLDRNPLKDPRVRRAISLAIDREFIASRLLLGQAVPAGDIAPAGVFGAHPGLVPDPYDPIRAKALLAEAGWPDGFSVSLHGSRDRSFQGAKACRAIALMLNGIGISCRPEALPSSEFYGRSSRQEFSIGLGGWGSITGETSYSLRMLLAGRDDAAGFGMANRGGYRSPAFDALLREAVTAMDPERRAELLREASALAIGRDLGIVPICYRIGAWATRRGIRYRPNVEAATLAPLAVPLD